MMNKLFKSLMLIFAMLIMNVSYGQLMGNEWINYNQTYFKFQVDDNGMHRIPQSLLQANGMGAVPGSQFALYRDGVEVPIYVSTNGVFGANDYIEFYGAKADGTRMDREMYEPNPQLQGNPDIGLIYDISMYFITYGAGNHLRLNLNANTVPPNPPAVEPYLISTVSPLESIRAWFAYGASFYTGAESVYAYTSKQDKGEGWCYSGYHAISLTLPTVSAYTTPNPKLTLAFLANNKSFNEQMYFRINGNLIFDTITNAYDYFQKEIPIQPSYLSSNTVFLTNATNMPLVSILNAKITYNRTFDFTGVNKMNFKLPTNGTQQRIVFSNLNSANQNTVVDFNTSQLYRLGTSNTVMLNATSLERNLFFGNTMTTINSLKPVTFRDYSIASNQGNYIILSHTTYINDANGSLNAYKDYRSSNLGGAYNVVIVDVNDLYEQFGYGYTYHPIAIKRFVKYAEASSAWIDKPEYMFIVGKGVSYDKLGAYVSNASLNYPIVPTMGVPGSDNLFAEKGSTNIPSIAIGRLSITNEQEIGNYLEKVKKYENAIRTPAVPNLENSLWKKRLLHIAGATGEQEQATFYSSLNACKNIIEDTLFGGIVTTTGKISSSVTESASAQIDSLIESGVQYVNFYGHASSVGFDYNLNTPDDVHSSPRFPIFMAFGCDVAAIFEPTNSSVVSEKYLKSATGGSIAMIACTGYGWTGQLDNYMQSLYRKISKDEYGKTLGQQFIKNIEAYQSAGGPGPYVVVHSQQLLLQGDPGIITYAPEKPDYYIDETLVSTTPSVVNTTIDSFEIKAKIYNLGKAVNDEIIVRLTKTKVGSSNILYKDSVVLSVNNFKDISFKVPVDPNNDIGLMKYTISINDEQAPDEITFANNKVTIQMYISEDNLKPIYPYDFSIVYNQNIELKASTLNPFLPTTKFIMELDTTEYFNSPLKQTKNVTSTGGVIKWQMPIQMVDSTVYYWRTTIDTQIAGKYYWNNSSFVYLANGSDGWNQSHYFQYKYDDSIDIRINEPNRNFKGKEYSKNLTVQCRVYGYGGNENTFYLNGSQIGFAYCPTPTQNSFLFVLIDPVTGLPEGNSGQYTGAEYGCSGRYHQFEFSTANAAARKNIIDFLDSVKDQYFIMVKSNTVANIVNPIDINTWKTEDEALNGTGISLYQSLLDLGLAGIAQYTENRPFVGVMQKGNPNFVPQFMMGATVDELVILNTDLTFYLPSGYLKSTIVGPAAEWKQLLWRTSAVNSQETVGDVSKVTVYGLNSADQQNGDSLFTTSDLDHSLSNIDAAQYPYLKLKWYTEDSVASSLPQLDFWRVLHKPLPEAALNPNAHYAFKDTLNEGEELNLQFAIENIRELPMDSMLVRYRLIDANNVSRVIAEHRYRKLPAYDTLIAKLNYNPSQFRGKNVLFVEANPDNDQPEHYHPNNLGYLPFYVQGDNFAPVMDVTFDGVHILNKDIVSAKPFINILIRDENKNSLIVDTSRVNVALYNDVTKVEQKINFDGNICRFIPASGVDKNEARVEFRPTLEDGLYTLRITSKDNANNVSGNVPTKYEISFEVINKSTITNVLNYPNPFSTSTQFLFTLTGSEIPSQFKIQIISVTGKVVREITKAELGNIHIGRNRTEYKWDGKDQYGQMLGNGVYLYRVITSNREGEAIEKRNNAAVDKYFKNDYGKLYIMR